MHWYSNIKTTKASAGVHLKISPKGTDQPAIFLTFVGSHLDTKESLKQFEVLATDEFVRPTGSTPPAVVVYTGDFNIRFRKSEQQPAEPKKYDTNSKCNELSRSEWKIATQNYAINPAPMEAAIGFSAVRNIFNNGDHTKNMGIAFSKTPHEADGSVTPSYKYVVNKGDYEAQRRSKIEAQVPVYAICKSGKPQFGLLDFSVAIFDKEKMQVTASDPFEEPNGLGGYTFVRGTDHLLHSQVFTLRSVSDKGAAEGVPVVIFSLNYGQAEDNSASPEFVRKMNEAVDIEIAATLQANPLAEVVCFADQELSRTGEKSTAERFCTGTTWKYVTGGKTWGVTKPKFGLRQITVYTAAGCCTKGTVLPPPLPLSPEVRFSQRLGRKKNGIVQPMDGKGPGTIESQETK